MVESFIWDLDGTHCTSKYLEMKWLKIYGITLFKQQDFDKDLDERFIPCTFGEKWGATSWKFNTLFEFGVSSKWEFQTDMFQQIYFWKKNFVSFWSQREKDSEKNDPKKQKENDQLPSDLIIFSDLWNFRLLRLFRKFDFFPFSWKSIQKKTV